MPSSLAGRKISERNFTSAPKLSSRGEAKETTPNELFVLPLPLTTGAKLLSVCVVPAYFSSRLSLNIPLIVAGGTAVPE
jgi:hypothetical protein